MLKCPQITATDADWPDGESGICENLREVADMLSWTWTVNAANETTEITGGWVTPVYDAAGNMTTMPKAGAETTSFTAKYDAWNRLVELRDSNNNLVARYEYDGRGFRTRKTLGDGTTFDYYQNDSNQLLEVRKNGSANAYEQYVYDQRYIDAPVMVYRDTNTDGTVDQKLYITQDANFNVTAVVDGATGGVVNRFVYTPNGQRTVLTATWTAGTTDFMLGHQGLYLDGESGLYYNRARYLHPTLGNFIQRDPLGYVDGANVYQYVQDNPANRVDPNGKLPPPVVVIGLPILAVLGAIKVTLDRHPLGTDDLTAAEQAIVDRRLQQLMSCAQPAFPGLLRAIQSLDIRTKFEDWREKDGNSTSETRKNLTATITILSNDFFRRDTCSQFTTLIHEAYHSSTGDFTENSAYQIAAQYMKCLGPCLGCAGR